jgi:hypothetical protein
MSKIQLPPKKENLVSNKAEFPKVSEKKIKEIISKGGSPVKNTVEPPKIKNFNLLIFESDLETISKLCDKRPKKIGRKISFSKNDWLQEAVRDKIEREKKEFNL